MVIYNVTSKVSWKIHELWVRWMLDEHMPEVQATGTFLRFQLLRLLEVEEDDGPTYAAQYFAASQEHYQKYIEQFAPALRVKVNEKWGDEIISFRSLMEVVN